MLIIAAIEQLTLTLELVIAQQILTIRVPEDQLVMTLTTDRLTQALVTIAQEVQALTMLLKAILTRVRLQAGHQATTRTALQAMTEVRQTILLLVEVLLALQVVLAPILVVLDLVQEEAVVVLARAALQEDQDNFKYKLNFIPR